eukprot:gene20377-22386_t
MAELTASLSKTEAKMADKARSKTKPSVADSQRNSATSGNKNCQKCQKKSALYVCYDCGDIYLCKDCNKTTHNTGSKAHSRKKHKVNELSFEESTINGHIEPKLIDFEDTDELNNIKQNGLDHGEITPESFLLVDGSENLQVQSEEEFINKLDCNPDVRVKVVSIFGNTGDGKSHTLNHTFFNGKEVFDTSDSQASCTVGVWASYDKERNALIIDTEGLLGISENANKRMRLLLKVLAISDVVIYRTRAERLHMDMFTFLGDASEAYQKYFSKDLKCVKEKFKLDLSLCSLGPAVIIFQETHYTEPLGKQDSPSNGVINKSPEDILRQNFSNVNRDPQAFSSITYLGTRTKTPPTNFTGLLTSIEMHLKNSTVRSPRSLPIIFNALTLLNEKFAGDIDNLIPSSFPDAYFTCQAKCQSCSGRCECSMSHERDDIKHKSTQRCKYQAQFDNRVFLCKVCFERGVESVVIPKTSETADSAWYGLAKYAWAGYVLECPECGVIYRSRQFWYGNRDPMEVAVRAEIRHVWPGTRVTYANQNAVRRIIDGVNSFAQKIGHVSAKPTKVVSNWVTDKVAPAYWVPNYQILECYSCGRDFEEFDKKHHCRACGQGFCDDCTTKRVAVPERGWGDVPVRVCDPCADKYNTSKRSLGSEDRMDLNSLMEAIDDDEALETGALVAVTTTENIPTEYPPEVLINRQVTESVQSTFSYLTSTLEYPKEYVIDVLARPSYWIPDSEITSCHSCGIVFKAKQSKHHCRVCGQGFCDACSQARLPVPSRGWNYPVRVCKQCAQKKLPL